MRTMKLTFAVFLPALMCWSCSMEVAKDAKEAASLECQMEKLEAEYRSLLEAGGSEEAMESIQKNAEDMGEKFKELKDRLEAKYKDNETAQKEFLQAFQEAKKKCG